jgi:uncharacterized protein (UPF0548 family)
MDILFPWTSPCLDRWSGRDAWPAAERGDRRGAKHDVYERVVAHEPPGEPLLDGPFRRAAAAILRFEVFPPERLVGVIERAPVELGDVVGAAYRFALGVRIFFASRVVERFDGASEGLHRVGFTYRTLEGHPELGEETFSVEKDLASGRVTVALRAWSRPGTALARVGAPIVRRIQVSASQAALDHLERIANAP